MPSPTLSCLPEELLMRILLFCAIPQPSRTWLAPLLVSRQFYRIGVPLYYHTIHLQSPSQTASLLKTLRERPHLVLAVRKTIFNDIWADCGTLLALCDRVDDVDICLSRGPSNNDEGSDIDAETFCCALERKDVSHLTIRKDSDTFLTHERPRYILERLGAAVLRWPNLVTVHFALRLSSSSSTSPLAHALSVAPNLRSVRSQVPIVWNEILLLISSNPTLEKITLYDEFGRRGPTSARDYSDAILGTGMYLREAKGHARLYELIKAGTTFIHTRAVNASMSRGVGAGAGTPLSPKGFATGFLGSATQPQPI